MPEDMEIKISEFEDDSEFAPSSDHRLVLDVDGFAGPIDVLLTLAREQKVDLTQISILELADQYLVWVAKLRQANLELAADYLVMAAWLAYLKSILLLPTSSKTTSNSLFSSAASEPLPTVGTVATATVAAEETPHFSSSNLVSSAASITDSEDKSSTILLKLAINISPSLKPS